MRSRYPYQLDNTKVEIGQHWQSSDATYGKSYTVVCRAAEPAHGWVMEADNGDRTYMTPLALELGLWKKVEATQ